MHQGLVLCWLLGLAPFIEACAIVPTTKAPVPSTSVRPTTTKSSTTSGSTILSSTTPRSTTKGSSTSISKTTNGATTTAKTTRAPTTTKPIITTTKATTTIPTTTNVPCEACANDLDNNAPQIITGYDKKMDTIVIYTTEGCKEATVTCNGDKEMHIWLHSLDADGNMHYFSVAEGCGMISTKESTIVCEEGKWVMLDNGNTYQNIAFSCEEKIDTECL